MQRSSSAWSHQTTNTEAYKRAGGRRRHNAQRQAEATRRRRALFAAHLHGDVPLWAHGAQAYYARLHGVSRATISRDVAELPWYVRERRRRW